MSTQSKKIRELIVKYWFRVLLQYEFNVKDVVNIIIELSNMLEEFDKSLSSSSINIVNDGTKVTRERICRLNNAFGKLVARPGMKYYWKLEMIHIRGSNLVIGVVEADESDCSQMWFSEDWGFGYHCSNGWVYNEVTGFKLYGDKVENN